MLRGWIYVITNPAMPALVKIGYSTKDPSFRAKELNNTGSPHPYSVAYDALLPSPRDMEQRVHKLLIDKREGKEWFRITVAEAISTIRTTAGEHILLERVNHSEHGEPLPHSETSNSINSCQFPGCTLDAERAYKEIYYCIWHFREKTNPRNVAAIRLLREEQQKTSTKPEK
ncbi:GIY-YIG nuclease family protein [Pseudomonas cavernicola]|uniref:GIY-YIG nuclease family protein n=1 Tax=Pseudomonas cavernicola TaxID=2320866 RepID=A0A418XEZ6_9PSED|nr:GIY-YIG nuclease family protein [Pseudomonas cavernicola]RJG11106.1 GIY-YIG nuclease family protein [Pseudomonas cavernicola]